MRSSVFSARALSVSVVGALSAAGCNYGDVALGGDETDDFKIGESGPTGHLKEAIDGGADLTFRQMFELGEGLTFADKPDPTALLTATNTLDDDADRAGRFPLTVLSYNVALLDVNVLGFIPYAETPDLEVRRRVTPGLIFGRGDDVILLQELWLDEDVKEFTSTAAQHGYQAFVQDRDGHNDGLAVFIRDQAIAGGSSTDVDFAAYASQNGTEYFPGPGIQRGWMSVAFTHPDIGRVRVFDTHMQAFPENWLGRMKQARELGIAMRTAASDDGNDELVLAGGDFNSGPYYKKSEWNVPDGSTQSSWFHNTLSYPVLLTYGELVDLAIMGRPANLATADVTLGDTVVNDADTALEIPGADASWCASTPATTFTATDCNSLYFAQYAGTEYPARLDHVFGHDPEGRIVATKSALVFTEKETFGDVVVEPSDHFGVAVELLVSPRK